MELGECSQWERGFCKNCLCRYCVYSMGSDRKDISSYTRHEYIFIFKSSACSLQLLYVYELLKREDQRLSPFINILKLYYTAVQSRFLIRPWAAIYPPPPPPRGILQGYIFLKAYTKCYKMSHVSTLAVGAFRIFWVKREEIMQKSLKIGNNF